jgi:tetratricopeptide (TPR) repeat protein
MAFAVVVGPFLDDGHDEALLAVHGAARAAAELLGSACDPADRAIIELRTGWANLRLGRYDQASEHTERALVEYTGLGHAVGTSRCLGVLGLIRDFQGRYTDAVEDQLRGLELARSAGLPAQEGRHLSNLAITYLRLEHYEAAADVSRQAVDVLAATGDLLTTAEPRYHLAISCAELRRDFDEALAMAEESLAVAMDHGRQTLSALAIQAIGFIYLRMGDVNRAVDILGEALALGRRLDAPGMLAELLNSFGEACREAGDYARSIECHREALDRATAAADKPLVARSEEFLGEAHCAAGRRACADEHWRQALRRYTDLGIPTAVRRLRERLVTP